jgi:protein-S-isoprenylcysteine O-methyltransferase Ste14
LKCDEYAVKESSERLISSLGLVSAAIILALCFLAEAPYPFARLITRWSGFILVAGGMLLVLWAVAYVGRALSGEIAPVLDNFITQGPYAYMRHPIYLGLTIALVGLTLAFNNWSATIAVFALFLPSQVMRARLEEAALLQRFGTDYEAYSQCTGFILPKLSKQHKF